jgi:hypothetical protein
MRSFPEELFAWTGILTVWTGCQSSLVAVRRWSNYANPVVGGFPQNSLQHSYSIGLLGIMMIKKLQGYIDINHGMIRDTLLIHDLGEAEVGHDTLHIDKTVEKDIREYQAFYESTKHLESGLFIHLKRAYLLQFCLGGQELWPDDARRMMTRLRRNNHNEALLFQAIERWDYLMYVLELYQRTENVEPLVQVLRHQVPWFVRLSEELPGFKQEIWTTNMATWCLNLLEEHKGQFIEEKSK